MQVNLVENNTSQSYLMKDPNAAMNHWIVFTGLALPNQGSASPT